MYSYTRDIVQVPYTYSFVQHNIQVPYMHSFIRDNVQIPHTCRFIRNNHIQAPYTYSLTPYMYSFICSFMSPMDAMPNLSESSSIIWKMAASCCCCMERSSAICSVVIPSWSFFAAYLCSAFFTSLWMCSQNLSGSGTPLAGHSPVVSSTTCCTLSQTEILPS